MKAYEQIDLGQELYNQLHNQLRNQLYILGIQLHDHLIE